MIAVTDYQWLCHPDVADPFRCPTDAAAGWVSRGWKPCDEPAEQNPAIAEAVAWAAQQAEAASKAAAEQTKTKKPRGETAADSTENEGVNDVG